MDFTVKVTGDIVDGMHVGTALIIKHRLESVVGKVSSWVSHSDGEQLVKLPFWMAVESDLFEDRNYITVKLAHRFCEFLYSSPFVVIGSETIGEYKGDGLIEDEEIVIKWVFNERKFIEFWKNTGYLLDYSKLGGEEQC